MALACGIEVCRSRCCMKDSVVALRVELEEVSVPVEVEVFSSDVDNGPIDEMCELQAKSICKN